VKSKLGSDCLTRSSKIGYARSGVNWLASPAFGVDTGAAVEVGDGATVAGAGMVGVDDDEFEQLEVNSTILPMIRI
jgi:hypothetical protein